MRSFSGYLNQFSTLLAIFGVNLAQSNRSIWQLRQGREDDHHHHRSCQILNIFGKGFFVACNEYAWKFHQHYIPVVEICSPTTLVHVE